MKWIAWGNRIVYAGGLTKKESSELGRFDSAMNAIGAYKDAFARWGMSVDYVQSVASYQIERREVELSKTNTQWKNRRGSYSRKREKKA